MNRLKENPIGKLKRSILLTIVFLLASWCAIHFFPNTFEFHLPSTAIILVALWAGIWMKKTK